MYIPTQSELRCKCLLPFEGEIFDEQKQAINSFPLSPNSLQPYRIEAMLKLNGIFFKPGKFGLSWKLEQLRLHPRNVLTHYAFTDELTDEDVSDADSNGQLD
jgi:hypothetical protein